ncbi:SGNH/GDSL hydrolase family protein [Seonamhaeicola sp. ML3]|uniref:SGNH/GDSL hydrolase family protein n=1 Tax=Seonamhaeicola sp. ML3 TaxID=2937786 RepID=UPI00200E1FD3|nr:SGNH/GDSL hydrolase family protein [Seonamhaeicola sp. ML3]
MNSKNVSLFFGLILLFYLGCSSTSVETNTEEPNDSEVQSNAIKLLSLGDSYTIGQSVCETCRFPEQLKDSLIERIENLTAELKVIATTGWTTTNLKNAIANENLGNDFDLATLLIGVNNQFQVRDFSIFETEFPELVNDAIRFAKGEKENLIVVSIPDYAFTPFGNGRSTISNGIDKYNNYIENYCNANDITYIYITDITREGLEKPELVASDGLHPSAVAYSKFVSRMLPEALKKLGL